MELTIINPTTLSNSVYSDNTNTTSHDCSIYITTISNEESPNNTTETTNFIPHLLPDKTSKQIRKLSKSHSIYSIFKGKTTQKDINVLASQCFSTFCQNYYQRYIQLQNLIESENPADELFITTINSVPMYSTDCCRYVQSYNNKFGNHSLIKNTILSDLIKLVQHGCPPMDIYKQISVMDHLGQFHYIVAAEVEATKALSALNNMFSIIDCNIAFQISYYNTILLLVGKKAFNHKFARQTETPLTININGVKKTSLASFISIVNSPKNTDQIPKHIPPPTIQEGTIYYFKNHKDYFEKHPIGAGRDFNVMLVNKKDEHYYFTGFGLPGTGLSHQEISYELIDLFNRPAFDDFHIKSIFNKLSLQHQEEINRLRDKIITIEEFYDNKGGWLNMCSAYLDINKIKKDYQYLLPINRVKKHLVFRILACILALILVLVALLTSIMNTN
ncbi:MAG: hypothetical protein KAG53_11050 [Endozoicomonadaceae bacterium]|nr:hypothetical protein [Endozoicomonadaceae bacterium]